MRRSRKVATLLAGTASLLVLTACEEEQPPQDLYYGDLQACKVENTPEECEKAFASAQQWHAERTDRYKSKGECENLFGEGRCEQVTAAAGQTGQAQPGATPGGGTPATAGTGTQQSAGAGSYFVPALMGFMLARSLGSGYAPGYPLYFDRQGYAYAGATRMGQCYPPESCPPRAGTSTTSRTGSSSSGFANSGSGRYSIAAGSNTSAAAGTVSRGGFGSTASRMSSGSSS